MGIADVSLWILSKNSLPSSIIVRSSAIQCIKDIPKSRARRQAAKRPGVASSRSQAKGLTPSSPHRGRDLNNGYNSGSSKAVLYANIFLYHLFRAATPTGQWVIHWPQREQSESFMLRFRDTSTVVREPVLAISQTFRDWNYHRTGYSAYILIHLPASRINGSLLARPVPVFLFFIVNLMESKSLADSL